MRGTRPARLRLPPRTEARAPRRRGTTVAPEALDPGQRELFEALRRHRLEVSRVEGVPPYVVASDRTLREIATLLPTSPEELEQVHGVGPAKVARYGAGLLDVVRNHEADRSTDSK
jgi:ATP-dependent DNA helicase RecQ